MPAPPRQRMFEAIHRDHTRGVVTALRLGANPNDRDDNGFPAIHLATRREPSVLMALIEAGADLNVQEDRWGNTALHWASMLDKYASNGVALIEAGADPLIRNEQGRTALDDARARGCDLIVRAIESRQAEDLRQRLEANTAPASARYATDDWAPTPEQKTQDLGRLTQSLSQGGDEVDRPVRTRGMRL